MTDFAPTDSLPGRVAVIAGGTGAIGMATAHRLAALGAHCVLLYGRRPAAEAEALAASLPVVADGQQHSAVPAEMLDSASLQAAAAAVQARHGVVHILVNSAGRTQPVPAANLEALTDTLIDEMLQVNFRGVVATMRAFMPLLQASGDGLIVNISSIAALHRHRQQPGLRRGQGRHRRRGRRAGARACAAGARADGVAGRRRHRLRARPRRRLQRQDRRHDAAAPRRHRRRRGRRRAGLRHHAALRDRHSHRASTAEGICEPPPACLGDSP